MPAPAATFLPVKSFSLQLFALTAALVGLGLALRAAGPDYAAWVHPKAGALLVFFAGLTWVTHALLERGRRRAPADLPVYFMGALTLRLLLGAGLAVAFIWSEAPGRKAFLADFFVLYMTYAGFEVWHLLRNLRPDSG